MRVLMFGWEFPPHIAGGLGTACYGMTRGQPRPHRAVFRREVAFGKRAVACALVERVAGRQRAQALGGQQVLAHSINDLYDADPPYAPRGAISQAWSVGAVLAATSSMRLAPYLPEKV